MKATTSVHVFVEIKAPDKASEFMLRKDHGSYLHMDGPIGDISKVKVRVDGDVSDAELKEAHAVAREAYLSVSQR